MISEPLCWSIMYPASWLGPRFNLTELARFRWIDRKSRKELATYYGKTNNAIGCALYAIRRRDFDLPGLSSKEREDIRWISKTF